jgi:hypothetical protein
VFIPTSSQPGYVLDSSLRCNLNSGPQHSMCTFAIGGKNKGDWCKDYAQILCMKHTQLEALHLYQLPLEIYGNFLNISRKFLNGRLP